MTVSCCPFLRLRAAAGLTCCLLPIFPLQGEAGLSLANQLAEVAFVPALLGIPGSSDCRRVLASCREAARREAWPLVWSQLPTVSAQDMPPLVAGSQLRISHPPRFDDIAKHIRSMGEQLTCRMSTAQQRCFSAGRSSFNPDFITTCFVIIKISKFAQINQ